MQYFIPLAVIGFVLAGASPASAQMCGGGMGSMMQSNRQAANSHQMCGMMDKTAMNDDSKDKKAGGCPCMNGMGDMKGNKDMNGMKNMPGMDTPKQQ
jgi:hypothetical protein